MSLAVNLAMKLSQVAAGAWRTIRPAPTSRSSSGIIASRKTPPAARRCEFGEIIAAVMGQGEASHGRSGRPGQRPHGEIGYHAVRTGDNPGEHTIIFGLLGETLEMTVRATNRDCYAHGALAAAKFLSGKKAGLYSMNDVLGL